MGLFLVLIIFIYRNRKTIESIKRIQFVAAKPISAGLFLSVGPFFRFHSLGPAQWRALLIAIVSISLLRLVNQLFDKQWKKRALYYLVFITISNNVLNAMGASVPVFRIYIFLTAAAGIYFCLCWAKAAREQGDGIGLFLGLRLGACFLAIVVVGELLGVSMLSKFLFLAVRAMALTISWWLIMRCAGGGLEWVVHRSNWPLPNLVRQNPDTALRRATFLVNFLLGVIYLSALLVALDIYQDPFTAIKGLLDMGVIIGEQRVTVGLALEAVALTFGAMIIARIVQGLLLAGVYERGHVDPDVRFSINRLITYAFVTVGALLALAVLGVRLTQLMIILSALGVGIGFGLKDIVNNFIGGLILLFERPIRVGDTIEMEGQWAKVKKIGLRATQIRTYDNADVIVPNNDLIINQVTNWTLSSRIMRLRIPVGVAYGSDISLVIKTLEACAKGHDGVSATPKPKIIFRSFGNSSLDFELNVWILDFDDRYIIQTELRRKIDQSFREAGIEITFPQRDLHLRSVDETVLKPLREPKS